MMRAPATVGQRMDEIDTPALLVDLDAFERNLRTLADSLKGRPVRVRAHAKTHKCPEIAKRQIAMGAVGVCCQKVSEAEAMVDGGVADVLITNEIVGAAKVGRIAALFRAANASLAAVVTVDFSRRTSMANAAVLGLGRSRRVVLSDTLLEQLPPHDDTRYCNDRFHLDQALENPPLCGRPPP